MATKLSLCNQALATIGEKTVITDFAADLASGQTGAVACNLWFDLVVKSVARSGAWNRLKTRAVLVSTYTTAYTAWLVGHPGDTAGAIVAGLAASPVFGWGRKYPLPALLVRLLQLNGVEIYNDGPSDFFEIEGAYLLTDAETADVQYIAVDPTDSASLALFDPLLEACVVTLLASNIAQSLRGDGALAESLLVQYQRITLPQARQKSGNERRRQIQGLYETSDWVRSRTSSTRG